MSRQELINTILMASVFVLVLSAWGICVTLWVLQYARRRRQLHSRLGMGSLDTEADRSRTFQLWQDERQGLRRQGRKKRSLGQRLEHLRRDAGWNSPAHMVFLAIGGMAVLAFVAIYLIGYGGMLASAGATGVVLTFWIMTQRRIRVRADLFERQLVDALGIAARALRAGHPLSGSFQLVSEEIKEPVGSIFGDICQEQALGLDLRESLLRVASVQENPDLKLFATAVGIQLRTGGNLAELMDTLAGVMRTRMQLHRRVRVLTSQANMSKQILIGLPIFMFFLMNFLAKDYMRLLYTTGVGRLMLMATVVNVVIGAWIMGKMAQLKY